MHYSAPPANGSILRASTWGTGEEEEGRGTGRGGSFFPSSADNPPPLSGPLLLPPASLPPWGNTGREGMLGQGAVPVPGGGCWFLGFSLCRFTEANWR